MSLPTQPWWSRPLTPDEHARIRRQLFLIPVYIWLVYAWWATLTHLPLAQVSTDPMKGTVRDFVHFYAQGVLANERGASALYDIDGLAAVVSRVLPGTHDVKYPPVYGPQVALFFAPLARLPYNAALYVWMTITVATFLACGWWVLSTCPRLRERRLAVGFMLLGAPALHLTLGFSQASVIGLACFAAAAVALRANRLFLAGLAVGMLAYKPPLGIACAFVFLLAGEWRVVAGALVGASAQLAAGVAYWGPGILGPYVSALRRLPQVTEAMEPYKYQMHSWRPFFQLLGLHGPAALMAYGLAAAGTLVVALAAWRLRRPLAVRFAVLSLATMLVDPHLYVYDLVILMPGLLLAWDWAEDQEDRRLLWTVRALLAVCYVVPLLGPLATVVKLQVSVPLMFILAVLVTWPHLIRTRARLL